MLGSGCTWAIPKNTWLDSDRLIPVQLYSIKAASAWFMILLPPRLLDIFTSWYAMVAGLSKKPRHVPQFVLSSFADLLDSSCHDFLGRELSGFNMNSNYNHYLSILFGLFYMISHEFNIIFPIYPWIYDLPSNELRINFGSYMNHVHPILSECPKFCLDAFFLKPFLNMIYLPSNLVALKKKRKCQPFASVPFNVIHWTKIFWIAYKYVHPQSSFLGW